MGSRLDATAVARHIVRKACQNLNEWIGGRRPVEAGGFPSRREKDWIAANRRIPARMIAAELRGLASATLAKYWNEMKDNQGVITAAKARWPQRKHAEALSIKGVAPIEGTMYEDIKKRICHRRFRLGKTV